MKYNFLLLLLMGIVYVIFIKDELYVSNSSIVVKDLGQNSSQDIGIGMLNIGVSTQVQDANVVETFLRSYDVLKEVDSVFQLENYYHHTHDPFHRLYSFSSQEYLLYLYRHDLAVDYDDKSGIITVSFAHTNPKTAQKITSFLIQKADEQLNLYNHRNAQKQLSFVRTLVKQKESIMNESIGNLETYQNQHKIFDPETDAATMNSMLANLEALEVQKESERNQLLRYMNNESFDIVRLNNEIEETKQQITKLKESMTGENAKKLNRTMVEFQRLKAQAEFDKKIYEESLTQLSLAQIDVSRQAKTLLVLTEANLPDTYTYPRKWIIIINLIVIFGLLYGITLQMAAIIKDHKD